MLNVLVSLLLFLFSCSHYCLHLLKMLKCPAAISLLLVLLLGAALIVSIQGAPVFNTLASRSTTHQDTTEPTPEKVYLTSLVSPPVAAAAAGEEGEEDPTPRSPTSPRQLPFIKVLTNCKMVTLYLQI